MRKPEEMMSNQERVVVLRDGEGNTYVLPWYLVERGRVAGEDAESVDEIAEGDVSGFAMSYFNGRILTASDFNQEQQATRPRRNFDLTAHFQLFTP